MNARLPVLALVAVLAGGALALAHHARAASNGPVAWKSQRIDLPYPGPHFSGVGADLLNANCSTCHSAEFVNGQPHLPLATWKMEVLKMKNVFHAQIDEKDVDQLAQFLFERHPEPAK